MEWELSALRHERLPAGATTVDPRTGWMLVRSGEAMLETGETGTSPLRAGDAALVAARTAYTLTALEEADLLVADLRQVLSAEPLPSPLVVPGFSGRHPGVAELVSSCPLGAECDASQFAVSYAGLVGSAMVSSWLAAGGRDDDTHDTHDTQVADVVASLVRRPGEPWTIDRMADLAHLSRSTLTDRFRRSLGASPMQALREVRMREARKLLGKQSMPVTRVAVEVGYGSVAAFSRAFATHHGMPPHAWRTSGTRDTRQRPDQAGGGRGGSAGEQRQLDPVPVQERATRGRPERDRHLERGHLQ